MLINQPIPRAITSLRAVDREKSGHGKSGIPGVAGTGRNRKIFRYIAKRPEATEAQSRSQGLLGVQNGGNKRLWEIAYHVTVNLANREPYAIMNESKSSIFFQTCDTLPGVSRSRLFACLFFFGF